MRWIRPPWAVSPDNMEHWVYPFIGLIVPLVLYFMDYSGFSGPFDESGLIFLASLSTLPMVRACLLMKYKSNSAQPILAALEKNKIILQILLGAISVATGFILFFAIFFVLFGFLISF